jgi:tRNA(fMet)-specific endonuclease VapC
MEEILLDTNIFSYLLRPGDTRAGLYRSHIQHRTAVISFITVGELYYWAERRKWGPAKVMFFEERMRTAIVVPYDVEVCRVYARLKSGLKNPTGSHRVIGDNDLWIAACAVRHGIPLVTHNRRHFEGIPSLKIICEAPQL